jgi:hypothetical protein
MKHLHLLLMMLSVVGFTGLGCGRSQNNAVEGERPPAASDPVGELKEAMKLFDQNTVGITNDLKAIDGEGTMLRSPTKFSFGVEKTASLVTPYTGVVKYFYPSNKAGTVDTVVDVTFAYQEGKWVVIRLCHTYLQGNPGYPDAVFCSDDKEAISKLRVEQKEWEEALRGTETNSKK